MANSVLQSAQTANNVPTNGTSITGPCAVFVDGVFDGAVVSIKVAIADTAARYIIAGLDAVISKAGPPVYINIPGTYYIRADVNSAGSSTSVTVTANQ